MDKAIFKQIILFNYLVQFHVAGLPSAQDYDYYVYEDVENVEYSTPEPPDFVYEKPYIDTKPLTIQVYAGETIRLPCIVDNGNALGLYSIAGKNIIFLRHTMYTMCTKFR